MRFTTTMIAMLAAWFFLSTAPASAAFKVLSETVCMAPAEVPPFADSAVPDGKTVFEGTTDNGHPFSIYANDRGNWLALAVMPNGAFCVLAGAGSEEQTS